MQLYLHTVPSHTPAIRVIQTMNQNQTGVVLVVDQQQLVGIFTAQDVVRAIAAGLSLEQVNIAAVMTQPVITLDQSEAADISLVLKRLRQYQIRYLPVINCQGQVVDIITSESIYDTVASIQPTIEDTAMEPALSLTNCPPSKQLTAEARYWGSEANLNYLLNSLTASIGCLQYFDANHYKVVFRSVGHEAVFGYTVQELTDDPLLWLSRVPPEDLESLLQQRDQAILAEHTLTIEYRFYHKDNSLRWISGTFTSERDPVQNCWIVTFVETDITERKRLELALQRSEIKLNQILNNINASIKTSVIHDNGDFEYDYISAGTEAVHGFTAEEFKQNKWLWRSRVFPEDLPSLILMENASNQAPVKTDYRFYHKDGSLRWLANMIVAERHKTENYWIVTTADSDITERKRAEADLKASEERFRQLVECIDEVFFINSQDLSQTLYVSPAYERIWGRSCESLYRAPLSWAEAVHPHDRERLMANLPRIIQGERTQSECRIIRPDGSVRWILCRTFPIFDETGQLLRHAGLAEDITERKQLELALQDSQSKLNDVFNSAVAAIMNFRVYADGTWQYDHCSAGCEAIYGYTAQEYLTDVNLWMSQVFPEDWERVIVPAFECIFAERTLTAEFRIRHKDGSLRWVSETLTSRYNQTLDCWVVITVAIDVSDRRRAEAALAQSEIQYRLLFENNPSPMWIYDLETLAFLAINHAAISDYGYSEPEFLSMTIADIVPAEDLPVLRQFISTIGTFSPSTEWRTRKKNGEVIDVTITSHAITWGNQSARFVLAQDITARKEAEAQLQKSEANLAQAQRIAHLGSWAFDTITEDISWSEESFHIFGLDPTQPEPSLAEFYQMVHPEDCSLLQQSVEQARTHGILKLDYRLVRSDGSIRYVEVKGEPVLDAQQKIVGLIGTVWDITERKLAEEALRQSEARFRAIFEHAGIGIALSAPPHYELEQTNPAFQQLLGYSAAELAVLNHSDITHPEDLQAEQHLVQQILTGNTSIYALEKRYIHKSGQIIWVHLINSVIRDAAGQVEFAIALVEDITTRKRAEQEIQFQANLLNQVRNAVICVDLQGQVIYWNRFAETLYQWTAEEVIGGRLGQFIVPPEQRGAMAAAFADLLQTHQAEGEYLLQRKDGSMFSAMSAISAISDQHGEITGFVGVSIDISDRKQAEELLKVSEKRLSLALSAAKAGTWERDITTNRGFWSEDNFRLLGYEPGSCEATYDNWLKAVHPDDQDRVERYMKQVQEEDTRLDLEYRVLLPDGNVRWLSDLGEGIHDEQGKQIGLIGIQIDVTERKQTEAQVQASLREKEVLLKEIHHRVKNNLQIVSSLLNLQAELIEDPQIRKTFEDSWSRVDSMALVHESLYQSHNFSSINFSTYIRILAAHLLQTYNIQLSQVTSKIEIDPQVSLSLNQAIPCGLILNELITNALKYGIQPGESGEIIITLKQSDRQVILTVGNRGDTLPPAFDLKSTQSMGLTLVINLVEQLEGRLELERGHVTLFRVSFNPLSEEDDPDESE